MPPEAFGQDYLTASVASQLHLCLFRLRLDLPHLGWKWDGFPKSSQLRAAAAKSANAILGCTIRCTESTSREVLVPLDKALMRPQLKSCVQFWSLYYRKDVGGKSPEKSNNDD